MARGVRSTGGRHDIQGPEGGLKPGAGSPPGTPGKGVRGTLLGR